MISDGKPFDTNIYFSGGAGMFLQYHDVVKPVYLYAIVKMIINKVSYGLPIDIIQKMSFPSLTEWYLNRRYINPLRSLDFLHKLDPDELDNLMLKILSDDGSIYKLSPLLNFKHMMGVYRRQHMSFPIYVYTKENEQHVSKDCKEIFSGINIRYLYGDLETAVKKCDQNFTYILSDIELLKSLSKILFGTCSHIILSRDYRYNYNEPNKTFKYDLSNIQRSCPFLRIGTMPVLNKGELASSFNRLVQSEGGFGNASS